MVTAIFLIFLISYLLPVEAVSSSTGTYLLSQSFILASGNEFFLSTRKTVVLLRVFLSSWKLLLKLYGSQFFKKSHISASGYQSFDFFRDSLKWEQLLCIVETYFSTNLLSGWWKYILCLAETVFLIRVSFSGCGNHYRNLGKALFKESA